MDFYVTFTCVHKPSENIPRDSIASVAKRYSLQEVIDKFGKKVFDADYASALKEVKELTYKLKQSDLDHILDKFTLSSNKLVVFVPEMYFNNYISSGYVERTKKLIFLMNERKIMSAWRKSGYPKYWGIEDPALPIKEKKDWINNFGSKELKRRFRRGQENQKMYMTERLERERPGWLYEAQLEGEDKETEIVPEDMTLLEAAKKVDESAVYNYWVVDDDDNEEIIIWDGFIVNAKFLGRDIVFLPEDFPKNMIKKL